MILVVLCYTGGINASRRFISILHYIRNYGEEEMEILLTAPTTSWVAVGWRPENLNKSCQSFPEDAPAPLGSDFHPMDCTDMVVGMARGMVGRIGDYYTRDRSTPRPDMFWGGQDDLLAGGVWEEDGRTVMVFRKNISGGLADQPLQGVTHLIWAMGQTGGFYGEDQFKWHGGNRGKVVIGNIDIKKGKNNVFSLQILLLLILQSLPAVHYWGHHCELLFYFLL